MSERPGTAPSRRPLHFFVLADCSSSMTADGKIEALNTAIRETIPHLVDIAAQNPHASVLMRVLSFATGARWHVGSPTPVEEFVWTELTARGYTDLGAALSELAGQLAVPPMEERALPPVAVLISDGMPTDDWKEGLNRLLGEPWGQRCIRMSIGIGRDADAEVLQAFIGREDMAPVTASNPEQLVRVMRWASTHAGRIASTMASGAMPDPEGLFGEPVSEIVW